MPLRLFCPDNTPRLFFLLLTRKIRASLPASLNQVTKSPLASLRPPSARRHMPGDMMMTAVTHRTSYCLQGLFNAGTSGPISDAAYRDIGCAGLVAGAAQPLLPA